MNRLTNYRNRKQFDLDAINPIEAEAIQILKHDKKRAFQLIVANLQEVTEHSRLHQVGETEKTVNRCAFDVAFDPVKAYKAISKWYDVRNVLTRHNIKSSTELESVLSASNR